MIVGEDILYVTTLLLAIFFTFESMDFPLRSSSGPKVKAGEVYAHVRAILYPLLGAATWYIMAAFAQSVNNCYWAYGPSTCYTSPTFQVTTSSIFADASADILFWFFWLMVIVEGVLFILGLAMFLGRGMEETANAAAASLPDI